MFHLIHYSLCLEAIYLILVHSGSVHLVLHNPSILPIYATTWPGKPLFDFLLVKIIFGPRFTALSNVQIKRLRDLTLHMAQEMGSGQLKHEGVYVWLWPHLWRTSESEWAPQRRPLWHTMQGCVCSLSPLSPIATSLTMTRRRRRFMRRFLRWVLAAVIR